MPRPTREDLFRAIREFVHARHPGGRRLRIRLTVVIEEEDGDVELRYESGADIYQLVPAASDVMPCPKTPVPGSDDSTPSSGLRLSLSRTEAAVLRVITRHWQSAEELAEKANEPNTSEFRAILRNLAERQPPQIESAPGRGWRSCQSGADESVNPPLS